MFTPEKKSSKPGENNAFIADSEDTWSNSAQDPLDEVLSFWGEIDEDKALEWDFDAYERNRSQSPLPPTYSPFPSWSPLPSPVMAPKRREFSAVINKRDVCRKALKTVFLNSSERTLGPVEYDPESAFQVDENALESFRFSFKPVRKVCRKLDFISE
jgi:hypothetical protein